MIYLLYRIEESNGFVAKRCWNNALLVAMSVYGEVFTLDNQIISPFKIYNKTIQESEESS